MQKPVYKELRNIMLDFEDLLTHIKLDENILDRLQW